MSERINLAELRPKLEREAARKQTYSVCLSSADTLALVEAVEAAQANEQARAAEFFAQGVPAFVVPPEMQRLYDALARFDFGEAQP